MNNKVIRYTFALLLSGGLFTTTNAMEFEEPDLSSQIQTSMTDAEQEILAGLLEGYMQVRNEEPELFNAWADQFYEIPDSLKLITIFQSSLLLVPFCGDTEYSLDNSYYLSRVANNLAFKDTNPTEKF